MLFPGVVGLIPSAVPASVSERAGRVHLVSVLGKLTLAVILPADVDHRESQGSPWLEAGNLFAVL